MSRVIKNTADLHFFFFGHSCQIQEPVMPVFFTQEGIVAKHNVVVFSGMKADHCCIVLLESEVLFDIKWVIPLRNSISGI